MDDAWADENPWDDDPNHAKDAEWTKISSDFHNAGYREGITAGKEAHLQQGFDEGFAQTGAPLGREIGLLRGAAAALLSLLTSQRPLPAAGDATIPPNRDALIQDARAIVSELNDIRFSDIAPPDLEAEQHAREHLEGTNADDREMEIDLGEEVTQKRRIESLEDAMARMGAGSVSADERKSRPTPEDVVKLTARLKSLSEKLGIPLLIARS